ncbi:hypothetical protein [Streptomyces sp. TLI_171]|uniref:hypothetical protein n=1 Tax=Streptomyces sp. TLI_171 TaxID=1938859 RepID=UPI000C196A36|nr:hypothetical protein [Streptomyces sp. TLI_171]
MIRRAGEEIGRSYGQNDLGTDRLNRSERAASGRGEMSERQYDKRFRLLRRMEARLARLVHEQRRREITVTGKGALAHVLPYEPFAADPDTAACGGAPGPVPGWTQGRILPSSPLRRDRPAGARRPGGPRAECGQQPLRMLVRADFSAVSTERL